MSRLFLMFSLGFSLLALRPVAFTNDLKPQSRMALIRAMVAEYGTLLSPLPRGEKGLFLTVDGQINNDNLTKEITQNGTAVGPQILVQISNIFFRDKEIAVEINGGGKKKTKWYEHIEVGMGGGMTPLSSPDSKPPVGSMITLVFPDRLQDLTVDEFKQYLSPVLDFTPVNPLQTFFVSIPEEFKIAIERNEAVAGMSPDMVRAALGYPEHKIRETVDGVEQEDWVYRTPPLKVTFVTFEADEVVNIQESYGGVHGHVKEYPRQPPR
jgi:hypothetical protein